jgi:RNA 2',3'-cyclic 3'-phosphodiesterase
VRLFTGIDLDRQTRGKVADLLASFRPTAQLLWSPFENLHITTKFIGDVPTDKLDELKAALRRVPVTGGFPVCLHGFGWFPNPHNPRSFFIGVDAGDKISQLARETNAVLAEIGIQAETKPFTPHLTLARIKKADVDLRPLRAAIAALPSVEFGEFVVPSFHLYLSELQSSGSRYTKIAEFPLTL